MSLSLLLLEGLLWILHPLPSDMSVRWSSRTDIPGLKSEIVFEKWQGLRGKTWTEQSRLEKQQGTLRVLVVGASTTESPAQESADAWWGVLETHLNSLPSLSAKKVEVLALGQSGFQASQIAEKLPAHLSRLTPDLLVTLLGVNDMVWPERMDSQLALRYRFRASLRSASQIYRHVSTILRRLEIQRGLKQGTAMNWSSVEDLKLNAKRLQLLPERGPTPRDPDPLPRFARGIQLILDTAREHGIPVLVLGQPVLWKPKMTDEETSLLWFTPYEGLTPFRASGAWLSAEMKRFNDTQGILATKSGNLYLNLDDLLPKSRVNFYDDCHLTDEGSIAVANLVTPTVERALLATSRAR